VDAALDEPGLDEGRAAAVESMPAPGGGAVLTFGTHGVDATRAELETRGDVRFDGENCSIDGWVRLATLYGPDGNVLMLYQDLSKD